MKHYKHRFSRNRAAGGTSHRETKRSSQFYNPEILKVHGDTKCPSMSDIITEQFFRVCPAYSVTEYDENRIPLVIFQVHCKCFGCHGPFHGHRHKCAPIFKFINAYRVVNKTVTGENIYTKVREPVSYGCKCKKDSFGLRHTYMYMPP